MRSRVILDELTRNHEVQVVVSGSAHDYLQKRLGEAATVRKIWGFTIVTEDNEVRSFKTLLENVKGAFTGGWPKNVKTYFELAEQFRPEIVISGTLKSLATGSIASISVPNTEVAAAMAGLALSALSSAGAAAGRSGLSVSPAISR